MNPSDVPCAAGGDCGGNCDICVDYPRADLVEQVKYKTILRQAFDHVRDAIAVLDRWQTSCPELSKSRDAVRVELNEPLALWGDYAISK